MMDCCEAVNNRQMGDIYACIRLYKSYFLFQAIEEEGGNPDEIIVHLEITPKKTPRRTPKGKKCVLMFILFQNHWATTSCLKNVCKTCLT